MWTGQDSRFTFRMVKSADVNSQRTSILDGALQLLDEPAAGGGLSLDRVAKQVGITKPGLMYHFPSKEALMLALVDHVVDRWESQLNDALGAPVQEAGPVQRITAYAEFTLSSTFGTSDIVMLADPRLRKQMTARWHQRIEPWVVIEEDSRTGLDSSARAWLNGVRLMADGAWLASATGVLDPGEEQRLEVLEVARDILKSLEVDG